MIRLEEKPKLISDFEAEMIEAEIAIACIKQGHPELAYPKVEK
ncbi:hypothetical protein ES703_32592 [subsurface metagenome]